MLSSGERAHKTFLVGGFSPIGIAAIKAGIGPCGTDGGVEPGVIAGTEQDGELVEAVIPVFIVTERCRIHVPIMAQPYAPMVTLWLSPSTQTFGAGHDASSEEEFNHVGVALR